MKTEKKKKQMIKKQQKQAIFQAITNNIQTNQDSNNPNKRIPYFNWKC